MGQFCARIGRHLGAGRVIGLDLVPERLEMARRHGIEVLDVVELDDVPGALIDLVDGRGPDAVIDAVGMEAHGSPPGKLAQTAAGLLPDKLAQTMTDKVGVDRLAVLHAALKAVRRGGTVSISGVYGGEADPMPLMEMFDRGIQLRMGQCHVRRWTDEILPLLSGDDDPLGVEDLRTHRVPLERGAAGVRDVPEEAGRLRQGRARAVSRTVVSPARPAGSAGRRPGRSPSAGTAWSSPPAPRHPGRGTRGVRDGRRGGARRTDRRHRAAARWTALADAAVERFGRIDVWVHTAAVMAYGRFEEVPGAGLRPGGPHRPARRARRWPGWRCGTSGPNGGGHPDPHRLGARAHHRART